MLTVLTGAAASAAGAVLVRRRISSRAERVELFFEDGTPVTVAQGTPEGERLLTYAHELLTTARAQ